MYDLVVIGGGPAGYMAASRASFLGLRVALIESQLLGGECTNWGCIPTKTLLEISETYYKLKLLQQAGFSTEVKPASWEKLFEYISRAVTRSREGVRALLSDVEVVEGWGRLTGVRSVKVEAGGSTRELESRYILVATGSDPKDLPSVRVDGEYVITNREFFKLRKLPDSITIVGAGAIGVELAIALAMLNKEVYIVEILDRALYFADPDVSSVVERSLRRLGVKMFFKATAKNVDRKNGVAVTTISTGDGSTKTLETEKVLLAIGRKPRVENLGLEVVGVEYDIKNGVKVDSNMATNIPTILAAGDVTGPPQLAHKALREALVAVEFITGSRELPPRAPIPQVVFSHPQVAIVGLTEQEAASAGLSYRTYKFPYVALGRNTTALAKSSEGFTKILIGEDKRVLGAQIVGNEASELIHVFCLAIAKKMSIKDLADTIYTHPTYSEAIGEVANLALGRPLHFK
ncbi:MAG: dihydrolipoyl dehydrogenase [Sulfolobales archaeon]|nr:dihydrolipoyl dehydrogenase [Sulfolobales archaeon]MDW8083079.1 dihydrolipoyl dehydrogenase [Sulfolobales archaeon]